MLKNQLLSAWRNLRKTRVFSMINIAGLAVGMAVCLLILQYVNFEMSYDQFNLNAQDLYRVTNDRYQHGKLVQHGTITYSGVGKAMKHDLPEVVDHIRVCRWGSTILSVGDKRVSQLQTVAMDERFFSMFTYPLLAGDARTALKDPHSVVLSRQTADKVFGVADYGGLIGRQVIIDRDSLSFKVTGVMEDMPENSHLQFDVVTSYTSMLTGPHPWKEADYDFTDSDFWHYIQLRPGTDVRTVEAKLAAFSSHYFQGDRVSGSVEKFHLQPVSRIHLHSDYEYDFAKTGSATVVWGLFIIAVFIISIAWVNYVNLSTARSVDRAKEVGIRKVTGATRGELIRQFLIESLLVNALALGIALLIVFAAQDAFNTLVQSQLSMFSLFMRGSSGYTLTVGLGVLLLVGVAVSAFYPAFVLSSFKPATVLKGKFRASRSGVMLRKGLVIGQFAITILLITGSVVVYQQVRFMNRQELGMKLDGVLVVRPPALSDWDSTFIARENGLKTELLRIPGVSGATTSSSLPGSEMSRTFNVQRLDDPSAAKYTLRNMAVDEDYLRVYGIRLLAGRAFDGGDYNPDPARLHTVLLSEKAVKLLGFANGREAVGKQITMWAGKTKWDVVGVFADFHQKSLRYAVEPTMLLPFYGTGNFISLKVNASDVVQTMAAVRQQYNAFFPGNAFDYFFLDESFNRQYKNDELFGKAFTLFAGLAISIACLGLLGLSAYATSQRIKEIGVRKVLGASVPNILLLLSRDFVWLVFVAFIIATPVAWMVMHRWLEDFAYRVALSPWVFLLAGLVAMIIALMTICLQSLRVARMAPVRSLRAE